MPTDGKPTASNSTPISFNNQRSKSIGFVNNEQDENQKFYLNFPSTLYRLRVNEAEQRGLLRPIYILPSIEIMNDLLLSCETIF